MDEQDSMNFAVAKRIMQWQTEAYVHLWKDASGAMYSTSKKVNPRTPHKRFLPFTDLNAAHQMEGEIRRRGLVKAYLDALGNATRNERGLVSAWGFAHATPEQRVRAALSIVERE